ncbi:hypothetical protein AAHH79_39785, partial [Burkholderia pseudomallei]
MRPCAAARAAAPYPDRSDAGPAAPGAARDTRSSKTKDFMKHSALSSRAIQVSVLALALAALAGCDSLNDYLAPDRVNY